MGVLVFIMAILPDVSGRPIHILRAEAPGPIVGKLVPRMKDTARILYLIYVAMTVLEIVILFCGGLSLFESAVLSFGTAGTGGFAILADGIASYALFGRNIPKGYEFTAEIDDEVEVVHKLDTKFINTSTEISENSTDNEVATAKSAYDLVQKAIQEALYVDKGDDV
jgi:hypothetical protein